MKPLRPKEVVSPGEYWAREKPGAEAYVVHVYRSRFSFDTELGVAFPGGDQDDRLSDMEDTWRFVGPLPEPSFEDEDPPAREPAREP